MPDAVEIRMRVSATDEASAVVQRAVDNATAGIRRIREESARAQASGFESAIGGLKETFGRSGSFTEAVHIFGGAGPLIGLGLATRELGEFAARLTDVRKLMEDGAGAPAIAVALAKSVPVLGDIVTAGQSIRELFTGEQEDIDRITASTKAQDEYVKAHVQNARNLRDAYAEAAENMRKINEETARVGLHGMAGELARQRDDLADQQRALAAIAAGSPPPEMQKELDRINDDAQKKLDPQYANRSAAKQHVDQLMATGAGQMYQEDPAEFNRQLNTEYQSRPGGGYFAQFLRDKQAADAELKKADAQITSLQNDQKKATAEVNDKYGLGAKAAVEKAEADIADTKKQYALQVERALEDSQRRINGLRAQAQAEALRSAGRDYEADLLLLKQNLGDENAAVDRSLQDRMEEIGEARKSGLLTLGGALIAGAEATTQANAQKSANQHKFDQDAAKAATDETMKRQEIEQRISDLQSRGIMSLLESLGKSTELQREQLRITEDYEHRREEILDLMRQATDEQKKQLQIQLDQLQGEEQSQHQKAIADALSSAATAPIQAAADGGSPIAKMLLKTAEIQQQFAQESAKLTAILQDKTSTDKDKALASSLLKELPREEKRAKERAAAEILGNIKQTVDAGDSVPFMAINNGMKGYASGVNQRTDMAYLNALHGGGVSRNEIGNFNTGQDIQQQSAKSLAELVGLVKDLLSHMGTFVSRGTKPQQNIFDAH